jgi:hypothetical protein
VIARNISLEAPIDEPAKQRVAMAAAKRCIKNLIS